MVYVLMLSCLDEQPTVGSYAFDRRRRVVRGGLHRLVVH